MNAPIPSFLGTAYRECQDLAFGHYENFPVASLLLSKEVRPHVAALYAFARTADDFADEERFEGRRLKELALWERGLKDALKGKKAPAPLRAFAHTVKTFQIPLSLPLALLRAFRMDVSLHRYSTWNSLLYYCRHSADPVGRMVLLLHGIRDEKLHRYSDFICSGLQLINFWQDSSIDLSRGRVYYPRSEWKKADAREKDLLDRRDSPAARLLVKNAVAFTEAHFRKGFPLLREVSGRLGLELRATCRGGLAILDKIRAMDHRVLEARPALGVLDKASIGLRSLLPGEIP